MAWSARTGFEVLSDAGGVAARVVELVRDYISAPEDRVLGLATGATFEPVYRGLVQIHRAGDLSFSRTACFNLDEYVGLDPLHPGSFRATMRRVLFDHVDVPVRRIHIPDGTASDLAGESEQYESRIAAWGGIGLQLLGIGRNGHVGFNEPGSEANSRTRAVRLSPSTLDANRMNFPDRQVPERAITMGVGTIMDARRIVLVATGSAKRAALAAALNAPVSPDCPASFLRRHPNLHIIADREAAPLALAA